MITSQVKIIDGCSEALVLKTYRLKLPRPQQTKEIREFCNEKYFVTEAVLEGTVRQGRNLSINSFASKASTRGVAQGSLTRRNAVSGDQ